MAYLLVHPESTCPACEAVMAWRWAHPDLVERNVGRILVDGTARKRHTDHVTTDERNEIYHPYQGS